MLPVLHTLVRDNRPRHESMTDKMEEIVPDKVTPAPNTRPWGNWPRHESMTDQVKDIVPDKVTPAPGVPNLNDVADTLVLVLLVRQRCQR